MCLMELLSKILKQISERWFGTCTDIVDTVGMSSPTNKSNLACFVNGVMKLVDKGFHRPSES